MLKAEQKTRAATLGALLGDGIAIIAALAVIALSVADFFNLFDLDWFKKQGLTIALCLIAFLILASVIERRISIAGNFQRIFQEIHRLFPDPLLQRFKTAGITNLYTSRADYGKYRVAGELGGYLKTATKTIHIIAYWLSHGNEMEGIARELADLVKSRSEIRITIAIVAPDAQLRESLATYLDMDVEDMTRRIRSSLEQLAKARDSLPRTIRDRFVLKVYDTLPIASTIMLDVEESVGRIQVDMKLYKTARQYTFGFEIAQADGELYGRIKKAALSLINDARAFAP